MSDQPRLPWNGAKELEDATLIYRAVLRERYIKNGIRAANFIRRSSDTIGLSVNNPEACTPQQLCATFQECYGTLTLQVGRVRGLGLEVIPDTEPDPNILCDHANITNLPFQNDNPERAEVLATALVGLVEQVWRPGQE